jgi:hypothetical protein
MAHFKYMGEVSSNFTSQHGPCLEIKVPTQSGDKLVLAAPDQVSGFVVGQDIGYDFTDARSLRFLRVDPRFQEIL